MTGLDLYRRRQALARRLHEALAETQQHRPTTGNVWTGSELAWVVAERATMIETVNQLRAELGLGPCRIDNVHRAERSALGHIDYATKWALYCTDTIMDDLEAVPSSSER